MFTVEQKVQNTGTAPVALYPYGVVERQGVPEDLTNFFILHEGVIGVADGQLIETDFDAVTEFDTLAEEGGPAEVVQVTEGGWIGFTGHYWQTDHVHGHESEADALRKLPTTIRFK